MNIVAKFCSVEELLDYCWARELEYPQVLHYAQANGLEMTNDDFFNGYSDRQAKLHNMDKNIVAMHY